MLAHSHGYHYEIDFPVHGYLELGKSEKRGFYEQTTVQTISN